MEDSVWKKFINEHFTLFNVIYSIIYAILYFIKGIQEGFLVGTYIVIGLNIIFIPFLLIFKKKIFSILYLIYSIALVFVLSTEESPLFNNFSALFIICIVFMIQPKLRFISIILYISAISVTFLMYSQSILFFFIHIVKTFWLIQIISYVLNNKFDRKKLILYEDEIKILEQLSHGKIYQKEVEGFSENTIYRKLKAARERNGNLTRDELVELYKQEKEKQNSEL